MDFVNWSVLFLKLLSPLYLLAWIIFSYSSLSSGSDISPSLYAFASSADNLYCAMSAAGFGGVPTVLYAAASASAFDNGFDAGAAAGAAAAAELDDAAAAELDDAAARAARGAAAAAELDVYVCDCSSSDTSIR